MKVTFKQVGQGDTIFLEWVDGGQNKIALIDCNLKENSINAGLDYFNATKLKRIEFIVLSHPHYDHFSGFIDLLSFCRNNNVKIGFFLYTMTVHKDYLMSAVKGNVEKSALAELIRLMHKLVADGIIEDYGAVNSFSRSINLQGDWVLSFLGPTQNEIDKYLSVAMKHLNTPSPTLQSANANLLSTLIKISNKKHYVLLTSDVTKNVFRRFHRKGMQLFKEQMILGQVSHHGSEGDYYQSFWKEIKKEDGTPLIISVGVNDYGHPSENVINTLNTQSYKVYRTDITTSNSAKNVLDLLDLVSTPGISYNGIGGNDITFDLNSRFIS